MYKTQLRKKAFEDDKKYKVELPSGKKTICTKLAIYTAGYLSSIYGSESYLIGHEVPKIEGCDETPELYILCNDTYVARAGQVFPKNIKVVYIHPDEMYRIELRNEKGENVYLSLDLYSSLFK